jgi:hypothetical protein
MKKLPVEREDAAMPHIGNNSALPRLGLLRPSTGVAFCDSQSGTHYLIVGNYANVGDAEVPKMFESHFATPAKPP